MITLPDNNYRLTKANSVDLPTFLIKHDIPIIRVGREYQLVEHDSCKIIGNMWYQFSQGVGGHPVDFLTHFYDKSEDEAIDILLDSNTSFVDGLPDSRGEAVKKQGGEFNLPEPDSDNIKAIIYLVCQRHISTYILNRFISLGLIYKEKDRNNVVFVGKDENGTPRFACRRGTRDDFKADVKGSCKEYGFGIYNEKSNDIYVFEAPIDLLSFLTIFYNQSYDFPNCVSLGGVSSKALLKALELHPHINHVYLCLDNDTAGMTATWKMINLLPDNVSVSCLQPQLKDWNDTIEHRFIKQKIKKILYKKGENVND